MLQRRLTRAGFDVTISMNGAECVDWAKTLLPDLIVMDLNLPGVDGLEATRRLKGQPETKISRSSSCPPTPGRKTARRRSPPAVTNSS